MKKLLSLILLLTLVLSLAACKFPWQRDETPSDTTEEETETPSDDDDGVPDLNIPGYNGEGIVLPTVPVLPKN